MTAEQERAVKRLVAILTEENAALLANDFGRIGTFMTEKQAALQALDAASADVVPADPPTGDPDELAVRLQQLVIENRTLLARAIKVQNRIMGLIANAARQAQAPAGYGAGGRRPARSATSAVALIVRA